VSFAINDSNQIQNQLGTVANHAALRQFFPQQLKDTLSNRRTGKIESWKAEFIETPL
jgi:hypothetical protein